MPLPCGRLEAQPRRLGCRSSPPAPSRNDNVPRPPGGGERMIPTRTREGNPLVARAALLRHAAIPLFLASISILAAFSWPGDARAQSWLMEVPTGLEPGIRWPAYVPGVLLVKFKSPVDANGRLAAVVSEGATLERDVTDDG